MFLTFEWTNLVTDKIDILLLIELYINDWQKHEKPIVDCTYKPIENYLFSLRRWRMQQGSYRQNERIPSKFILH